MIAIKDLIGMEVFIMLSLFAVLLMGAGAVQLVKKYILRIPDPTVEEMWSRLEEEEWYQELIRDEQMAAYMEHSKHSGLLSNWYYVKKIIEHKGTRDGFLSFVEEELGRKGGAGLKED